MGKKKKKDLNKKKDLSPAVELPNNDELQTLIDKAVEDAVSSVVRDLFRYGQPAHSALSARLSEELVKQIDTFDMGRFVVKLDTILADIVENCNAAEMSRHLTALSKYTQPLPPTGKMDLGQIIDAYGTWCAETIDTDKLEINYDEGPAYAPVTISASIECNESQLYPSFTDAVLHFTCAEDETLNVDWPITNWTRLEYWSLSSRPATFPDIISASDIELRLAAIANAATKIYVDESDLDDEVEFEIDREPEPTDWR